MCSSADIDRNLADVMNRIMLASERSGNRRPVKLVVVTKTVPVEVMLQAVRAGVDCFGENRIQEARAKFAAIGRKVEWHLVGHLQTNKVRQAVEIFDLIHSLDRWELALELEKHASRMGRVAGVLVQVNASREESKHGLNPCEVVDFIGECAKLVHLKILGLMTIGPLVSDPEEARPCFRATADIAGRVADACIPGVEMRYLSMGMTGDFEVAIEEGANMVRIGSGIFGPRPGGVYG